MAVKKRSKKKTGATRNPEKSTSSWSWVMMALLVGCFVTFLVYLDRIPTEGGNQIAPEQVQKKAAEQKKKDAQKEKPKHQFDFYTVLPEREVKVNNVSAEKPKRKVTAPPKKISPKVVVRQSEKKSEGTFLYQLQVGAFKELPKADAMKARLAFIGVESNIQVIQRNGQKMYRVRVGPSTDEQRINQIKNQLKAQNINTFMQKLNG